MKLNFKKTAVAISIALCGAANAKTETMLFDNQLEFTGLNDQTGYELRLRLPKGELKSLYINPSKTMTFDAMDFAIEQFQDGMYKYELIPLNTTVYKNRTNQSLTDNKNEQGFNVLAGTFTVFKGSTLIDQDESTRDQVIIDDLIVDGSACIGQDCVNGESFGFDTLRLKENNLRIKFDDTSNSASFPSNDWQLTANDSSNGGANKFSLDDITGSRTPFTVEAGARSNALYVDSAGRIGVGTNNPVVEMHITDGDSPTVRLEQNGTSGWTPQIWDLAGNETNFFVRDVTNGSTLPFRIKPGSPSQSIFIQPDGIELLNNTVVIDNDQRMGIGTNDPKHPLHIATSDGNSSIRLENIDSNKAWKFVNNSTFFEISLVGSGAPEFIVSETGTMEIKNGQNSMTNLNLDTNGNMTIRGSLSQNSDVNSKENIYAIDTNLILQKVMDLPISVWNYKFDDDSVKHLGPMAQDFFKMFDLGEREDKISTIDTSGVALAAIKALGDKLEQKNTAIESLQSENKALSERLTRLEEALLNK